MFSPLVDIDMNLACQIIVTSFNASMKVQNVIGNVPLGHWDGDQVQIGHDATDADADVHVEKQVATMRASIFSDRKRLDRWV